MNAGVACRLLGDRSSCASLRDCKHAWMSCDADEGIDCHEDPSFLFLYSELPRALIRE